jgi:hypothetical protein
VSLCGENMYEVSTEAIQNGSVLRYRIRSNSGAMSYRNVLQALQDDAGFRNCLTDALIQCPYSAFRWETPPLRTSTLNQDFEFVLLDFPSFTKRKTDESTYKSYFASDSDELGIVAFTNLGGDATLIVPSPRTAPVIYGHFASFLRNAPVLQIDALWQKIGTLVLSLVSQTPVWLSTAGGGVAWLHVRIDSTPKYYGYTPYCTLGEV